MTSKVKSPGMKKKLLKGKKKTNFPKAKKVTKAVEVPEEDDFQDEDMEEEEDINHKGSSHSKSMKNLANSDPDFYNYLQQNQQDLLGFNEDSSDEEDLGDDDDEVEKPIPKKKGSKKTKVKVTEKLLAEWSLKLHGQPDINHIKMVIDVFSQVVTKMKGETDEDPDEMYKVEGDMVNTVIKMCVLDLSTGLLKVLGLDGTSGASRSKGSKGGNQKVDVKKCKNWKSLKSPTKQYLVSLMDLLGGITDDGMSCSLLRHILHLMPIAIGHPVIVKKLIKLAITLWSEASQSVRILSFLVINRLVRESTDSDRELLPSVMKRMYMSFIKNCKLTTFESRPLIGFMTQSLMEMYSLDTTVAYNHSFVYIRQCGILLRSFMNGPDTSKEPANRNPGTIKTIYNWSYVHSLVLWQKLVCLLHKDGNMRSLVYPLTQVMLGTIKLNSNGQLIPFRFHLIESLIQLGQGTNTYIPLMPLILQPLDWIVYKKTKVIKQKVNLKGEVKPEKKMLFNNLIKIPKGQVHDQQVRVLTLKSMQNLMFDYCMTQSHSIAFPEVCLVPVLKLKKFLNDNCKSADDSRIVKTILEKMMENCKFIETKRKTVQFTFSDTNAVAEWEKNVLQNGTPITIFYAKWKKLRRENEKKDIEQVIQMAKSLKDHHSKEGDDDCDVEHANGDDGAASDEEEVVKPKDKKGKRKNGPTSSRKDHPKKKKQLQQDGSGDGNLNLKMDMEGLEMSDDD